MRSYLVSMLAAQARTMSAEEFETQYPYAWLIWEPGSWKPPANVTVKAASAAELFAQTGGEALVLALLPRARGNPEVRLGRGGECDLVVNDGTLSGIHLIFRRTGDDWTVRDPGSRNGTLINGVKLPPEVPMPLRPGTVIQAAAVKLTFLQPSGLYERVKALKK